MSIFRRKKTAAERWPLPDPGKGRAWRVSMTTLWKQDDGVLVELLGPDGSRIDGYKMLKNAVSPPEQLVRVAALKVLGYVNKQDELDKLTGTYPPKVWGQDEGETK